MSLVTLAWLQMVCKKGSFTFQGSSAEAQLQEAQKRLGKAKRYMTNLKQQLADMTAAKEQAESQLQSLQQHAQDKGADQSEAVDDRSLDAKNGAADQNKVVVDRSPERADAGQQEAELSSQCAELQVSCSLLFTSCEIFVKNTVKAVVHCAGEALPCHLCIGRFA